MRSTWSPAPEIKKPDAHAEYASRSFPRKATFTHDRREKYFLKTSSPVSDFKTQAADSTELPAKSPSVPMAIKLPSGLTSTELI